MHTPSPAENQMKALVAAVTAKIQALILAGLEIHYVLISQQIC